MRSLPYRPPPDIMRPQQLHVHDRFKKAKSASLSGKLRLRRSDRSWLCTDAIALCKFYWY
ncbi:hypothetical protein H6G76_34750 [Nostoc sp. FACHB-152]|uniref:hypothetical protein n=1 Tax=Nostoc sp. FACHB-152 TaxID=2692837 RepID=UPI0016883164|nr:hypothetical protein [Nostoc sp. FACHB-152]MBD2452176.1 hypothetical protein [Nostoc sp. FACHB-152]